MKPVATERTNFTYKLPGGTEENDLPCERRDGKVFATWELDDNDRAMLGHTTEEGHIVEEDFPPAVVLFLWWPNKLGAGLRIGDGEWYDETKLDAWTTEDSEGRKLWAYRAWVTEREATILRDGGHIEAMIDLQAPPPSLVECR